MKAIVKRIVDGDTLIADIYIGVKVLLVPVVDTTITDKVSDIPGKVSGIPGKVLDISSRVLNIPDMVLDIPDRVLGMDLYVDPNGMLVMRKVRVRLYRFYAPEMCTPEGVVARDRLIAALPLGTEIELELHGKDKYGRWLGTPMLNGTNVCLSLSSTT